VWMTDLLIYIYILKNIYVLSNKRSMVMIYP
jgi:hypothetical protein